MGISIILVEHAAATKLQRNLSFHYIPCSLYFSFCSAGGLRPQTQACTGDRIHTAAVGGTAEKARRPEEAKVKVEQDAKGMYVLQHYDLGMKTEVLDE